MEKHSNKIEIIWLYDTKGDKDSKEAFKNMTDSVLQCSWTDLDARIDKRNGWNRHSKKALKTSAGQIGPWIVKVKQFFWGKVSSFSKG